MMKSLAARVLYAPKDFPEANEISQELGFTTVKVRSLSKPLIDIFDPKGRRSRSVNVSEQKRPLMLPQEVKELGRDREIVLYEGLRPILGHKNRYYQDPVFKKRLFPPPRTATPFWVSPPLPPAPAGSPADLAVEEGAPRTRDSTLEDIERIETLTLEDFDIDPALRIVPDRAQGERPTREELDLAVQHFLAGFHER